VAVNHLFPFDIEELPGVIDKDIRDFIRHLKNFPGDRSAVVDNVNLVTWKDFPGLIRKIKLV
jgi:hypothetical protein